MKRLLAVMMVVAVTAFGGQPVLETDAMRVEFGPSAEGFGLRRIVNKAAGGCSFVAPLPRCTFSWRRTEANRGMVAYTNDLPAVIGSVWRNANDSKMAVVAVNISPARQTVRFRTPAGRDDLSAHPVDGQPAPEFAVSAGTAALTLAPRQIAILEQPAR